MREEIATMQIHQWDNHFEGVENMSEKGFLFSIDALLAVSAIIAVSIAFFFLAPKTDSELLQVQMLRITANDKAITSFWEMEMFSWFLI